MPVDTGDGHVKLVMCFVEVSGLLMALMYSITVPVDVCAVEEHGDVDRCSEVGDGLRLHCEYAQYGRGR